MRLRPLIAVICCVLPLLSGCGVVAPHRAVPEPALNRAALKGFPDNIRYYGDEAPTDLTTIIQRRIGQYQAANAGYYKAHGKYPDMSYLAISGGGDNGAFAAGLLYGWTQAGDRPEFNIVTGVSTGALIASFAFLGSEYDEELKQVYTTLNSQNIFLKTASTIIDGLTGGMALADNTPLKNMIERQITPEMFARIGAEHLKGRRLLIGTTNLEKQRSIIWDIGKLATSGAPGGVELFRKVLLASAAIPGAFRPVFVHVTADGHTYSEIHVDGGVTAQVILYPFQSVADEKRLFEEAGIARRLYVMRNAKIVPEYQMIGTPHLLALSSRSIETLIKNQGIGDLFKLYAGAKRDGIDFNLIHIPQNFAEKPQEAFDPRYMSKLFELGKGMAQTGIPWQHTPPNYSLVMQQQSLAPAN